MNEDEEFLEAAIATLVERVETSVLDETSTGEEPSADWLNLMDAIINILEDAMQNGGRKDDYVLLAKWVLDQ